MSKPRAGISRPLSGLRVRIQEPGSENGSRLESHPRSDWGMDAMSQLRNIQLDASMPQPVRDAAQRLTTKITGQFTSPFSTNPIEDSKIIINHLMGTS